MKGRPRLQRAETPFGERLLKLMGDELPDAFGKRIGKTGDTIRSYLKTSQPRLDVLVRIVQETGADPNWLLTGEGEMKTASAAANPAAVHFLSVNEGQPEWNVDDSYVSVPLLADAAAAGTPREVSDDEIEGHCIIHKDVLGDPKHTTCIRIHGDSMAPILTEGSIVAVNHRRRKAKELDKKLIAAYHEGGVTVKRLMISGTSLLLEPENRQGHTPSVLDPGEDRIIGAVEWAWVRFQ